MIHFYSVGVLGSKIIFRKCGSCSSTIVGDVRGFGVVFLSLFTGMLKVNVFEEKCNTMLQILQFGKI